MTMNADETNEFQYKSTPTPGDIYHPNVNSAFLKPGQTMQDYSMKPEWTPETPGFGMSSQNNSDYDRTNQNMYSTKAGAGGFSNSDTKAFKNLNNANKSTTVKIFNGLGTTLKYAAVGVAAVGCVCAVVGVAQALVLPGFFAAGIVPQALTVASFAAKGFVAPVTFAALFSGPLPAIALGTAELVGSLALVKSFIANRQNKQEFEKNPEAFNQKMASFPQEPQKEQFPKESFVQENKENKENKRRYDYPAKNNKQEKADNDGIELPQKLKEDTIKQIQKLREQANALEEVISNKSKVKPS